MNWYQYILLELYGTNWLASNFLLLVSKKCFLSSQGLVGAGMNCRALYDHTPSAMKTRRSQEPVIAHLDQSCFQ
jgi:hypothetical protein